MIQIMRSIKPGRGPSAMGGAGSVVVGVFGVFWTIGAASMGAPAFFVLFGIVFVGIAVVQAIYHFKNATSKNRMSLYDITDREPDPIDNYLYRGSQSDNRIDQEHTNLDGINYCPHCGNKIADDAFKFCPKCGQALRASSNQ